MLGLAAVLIGVATTVFYSLHPGNAVSILERAQGTRSTNEVGGIAATNYSSCGECFGVILARITWEDIGLIKR